MCQNKQLWTVHAPFFYSLQHCRLILKHNKQDATCTIFFTVVSALHVSSGFSAHHQELKNCSDSPTLAVAANKFDKYPMLHVEFWAPDDERKTRSKHVEHWQQ
jgi:hypothetical protein